MECVLTSKRVSQRCGSSSRSRFELANSTRDTEQNGSHRSLNQASPRVPPELATTVHKPPDSDVDEVLRSSPTNNKLIESSSSNISLAGLLPLEGDVLAMSQKMHLRKTHFSKKRTSHAIREEDSARYSSSSRRKSSKPKMAAKRPLAGTFFAHRTVKTRRGTEEKTRGVAEKIVMPRRSTGNVPDDPRLAWTSPKSAFGASTFDTRRERKSDGVSPPSAPPPSNSYQRRVHYHKILKE